jgi:1-acyl-sn-glycerol-3-phosphate acyltransferase
MFKLLKTLVRLIAYAYLDGKLQVLGKENIPSSGPVIVCANHFGTPDPPLIPAFIRHIECHSMAKIELFDNPLLRLILVLYKAFPVVRHRPDRKALNKALSLLQQGKGVVVYPEGTRSSDGRLKNPEPGVGYLVLKSAAPVLPVGISGTNECMPKGRYIPKRVPVRISFGVPFIIKNRWPDGHRVSYEQAAELIMAKIAEQLPEENRGMFVNYKEILASFAPIVVSYDRAYQRSELNGERADVPI